MSAEAEVERIRRDQAAFFDRIVAMLRHEGKLTTRQIAERIALVDPVRRRSVWNALIELERRGDIHVAERRKGPESWPCNVWSAGPSAPRSDADPVAPAAEVVETRRFHAIPAKPGLFPPDHRRLPNPPAAPAARDGIDPKHRAAAMALLTALCRQGGAHSWEQTCTLAGLVPGNGYFYGGRKQLLSLGLVENAGASGQVMAALAGLELVPNPGPKLEPGDIVQLWSVKLAAPAPQMLAALFGNRGDPMTVAMLATAANVKPGNGYWYGGLKRLRAAGLVEQDDSRGAIRLTEILR